MFPAPRRPGYKVPSVLAVPQKPTRAQVEHERFQAQLLAAGRAEYDELAILRSTLASPRDGLRTPRYLTARPPSAPRPATAGGAFAAPPSPRTPLVERVRLRTSRGAYFDAAKHAQRPPELSSRPATRDPAVVPRAERGLGGGLGGGGDARDHVWATEVAALEAALAASEARAARLEAALRAAQAAPPPPPPPPPLAEPEDGGAVVDVRLHLDDDGPIRVAVSVVDHPTS
jgi:hypothetical protein